MQTPSTEELFLYSLRCEQLFNEFPRVEKSSINRFPKNGITRLLSQTHWLVALTRFVHPATRRLRFSLFVAWPNASGPMNFSARASPATRVSRRVCLRESLHRDLRAMRQVSKHNDWTAPIKHVCALYRSAVTTASSVNSREGAGQPR